MGWDILHDFKKATHETIAHLCGSSYDHAAVADAVGLANFDDALPSSLAAGDHLDDEVSRAAAAAGLPPPPPVRNSTDGEPPPRVFVDDESVAPAGSKRFAIAAALAAVAFPALDGMNNQGRIYFFKEQNHKRRNN